MNRVLLSSSFFFLVIVAACTPDPVAEPPQEETSTVFRQPSWYVQQFIASDSIAWNSINHQSFRIYYQDSSYTQDHLPRIQKELDTAMDRIFEVLDITSYPHGVYLLAVDSEEDMEELMGYHIKGGAAKGHDLVFFTFNDSVRPQFKHEIFHLIGYETWGLTESRLLDEGGAMYTDNECFYNNPMYSINAYFLQEDKLFPLEELVHEFDAKARENDVIAYIQSAGYFKYLYETHGIEKMKRLWVEGFESFQEIYGFSLADLEESWKEAMQKIPVPEDIDEELLMSQGCG